MRSDSIERTLETKALSGVPGALIQERTGTLTVLMGADVGAVYALSGNTLIGRSPDAQIMLDDDGASRSHAEIVERDGDYELRDLASTNGTYVGQQRLREGVVLADGARIQIGNTLLRFSLQDQVEQDASRRIYEMSVRDGLTGVFNRRYFEERLASEFAFASRHKSSLCVLLCDVDHFKKINDRFGHQAGDEVLRRIAAELRTGVRTEDVLARYGGEEFAVLGRGIDLVGARQFAERVRLMAERAHIVWEGTHIPVTISIGLSHNQYGEVANSADRLVAAADSALYAAKRAGRNRVEAAATSAEELVEPAAIPDRPELAPRRRRRDWEQATSPSDEEWKRMMRGIGQKPTRKGDV
jgi:two-component system, cell cycle response regulator